MRNFIRLASSDFSLDYCFKIVMGTYKPEHTRTQSRRRSVTGVADTAEGAVIYAFTGVVLTSASLRTDKAVVWVDNYGVIQSTGSGSPYNYGTLANLESLYALNNPSASPSSRLYLYDFTMDFSSGDFNSQPPGTQVYVVEFVGPLITDQLSPGLIGEEAHFYVPIRLEKVT